MKASRPSASMRLRVRGCVETITGRPKRSAMPFSIAKSLAKLSGESMFSSRCALTTK
jgi:hypothetical protein